MNITEFILTGRDNAITVKQLCALTGKDSRTIQQQVEDARRDGAAICASQTEPFGLYLAADRTELDAYISSLKRREREIYKTRRACERTLKNMTATAGWAYKVI